MIPKIITPFSFEDRQNIVLVEAHSRGVDNAWMRKNAAAGFSEQLKNLKPEKGHAYLHMLALGDGEWYGSNRNGDYFPKKANVDYHDTFVKHAHVYKHHQNKDPKKASGEVLASTHNEPMKRVELLAKVAEDKWSGELSDMEAGKDVPLSMSCTVPFDVCSICDNKAPSRKQYCDHLKYAMTSILDDGRQVFAINTMPKFFDISRVGRPADRTAYVLKKVASVDKVSSGAELAEQEGLVVPPSLLWEGNTNYKVTEKMAIAQKLADIEKEIDGVAIGATVRGKGLLGHKDALSEEVQVVDDKHIKELSKESSVWSMLSDAKVSLPVTSFVKLVTGDKYNEVKGLIPEIKSAVPGMFNKLLGSTDLMDTCSDSAYDVRSGGPLKALTALHQFKDAFSLAPTSMSKRAAIMLIRGTSSPLVKSSAHYNGVWKYENKEISKEARVLVNEYAKYKISLAKALDSGDDARLIILQNYV